MLNRNDGVLTFERPSLRIGPALTRSEFLAAEWAAGASNVDGPSYFTLAGFYWSESQPFRVIMAFDGERLRMLDLRNADAQFSSTSWDDFEDKEGRRKHSHDAWLSKSLGDQRSFAWGAVGGVGDNHDPHGGESESIIIRYSGVPADRILRSTIGVDTSTAPSPRATTFPPPPRLIRRRWHSFGHAVWVVLVRAVAAVFILTAIWIALVIPVHLIVARFGTPVVATVSDADTNNRIDFKFFYRGQPHSDWQELTPHDYSTVRAGQALPARTMQLWNWTMCVVVVGDADLPLIKEFAKPLLFFDGFVVIFMWVWLSLGADARRLVRGGARVIGTITHKYVSMPGYGLPARRITCKFKTSEGGEFTKTTDVCRAAYKAAQVGAAVTVIYDPARPTRSVAYEYGDYEVVPITE
jgi:hypothetical protein